jgi:hypothetical protein
VSKTEWVRRGRIGRACRTRQSGVLRTLRSRDLHGEVREQIRRRVVHPVSHLPRGAARGESPTAATVEGTVRVVPRTNSKSLWEAPWKSFKTVGLQRLHADGGWCGWGVASLSEDGAQLRTHGGDGRRREARRHGDEPHR